MLVSKLHLPAPPIFGVTALTSPLVSDNDASSGQARSEGIMTPDSTRPNTLEGASEISRGEGTPSSEANPPQEGQLGASTTDLTTETAVVPANSSYTAQENFHNSRANVLPHDASPRKITIKPDEPPSQTSLPHPSARTITATTAFLPPSKFAQTSSAFEQLQDLRDHNQSSEVIVFQEQRRPNRFFQPAPPRRRIVRMDSTGQNSNAQANPAAATTTGNTRSPAPVHSSRVAIPRAREASRAATPNAPTTTVRLPTGAATTVAPAQPALPPTTLPINGSVPGRPTFAGHNHYPIGTASGQAWQAQRLREQQLQAMAQYHAQRAGNMAPRGGFPPGGLGHFQHTGLATQGSQYPTSAQVYGGVPAHQGQTGHRYQAQQPAVPSYAYGAPSQNQHIYHGQQSQSGAWAPSTEGQQYLPSTVIPRDHFRSPAPPQPQPTRQSGAAGPSRQPQTQQPHRDPPREEAPGWVDPAVIQERQRRAAEEPAVRAAPPTSPDWTRDFAPQPVPPTITPAERASRVREVNRMNAGLGITPLAFADPWVPGAVGAAAAKDELELLKRNAPPRRLRPWDRNEYLRTKEAEEAETALPGLGPALPPLPPKKDNEEGQKKDGDEEDKKDGEM
ncbi:hypothetical protein BT63DRAFT_468981 [Microthyrium microscopicum]|uniref:Uncharacterized protein n=1 Tax=Microthyrium microscopicum TaxID=703497 RepID=A0A6A6UHW8_9PEZI|nr:hypothetical protein BT63DRAFT_468981 [Microthyrium microscopicum]